MKFIYIMSLTSLILMVFSQICDAVEIEQVEKEMSSTYPQEHWYNLTLMGMKIGHIHLYIEKTEYEDEEMIRTKTDTVMQFKGLGKQILVETNRVEYSDLDYMPRYFVSSSNESGEKHVEGKIKDGVAHIITSLNGQKTESEVELPQNTTSDAVAVDKLLSKNLLKIGEKLNYYTFNFDMLKPIKSELSVVDKDKITYNHIKKQVYILEQKMDILGGINTRLWVDSEGVTYKSETNMMGQSFSATKTDRKNALGEVEEVDITLNTRIIPTGKRPKTGASRFVANVQLSKGNLVDTIMAHNNQKIALKSKQTGTLTIEMSHVEDIDCPVLPIRDPENRKYLSATAFVEADNQDIRNKAVEIIDDEENSWRAAKKLCKWVYKSIKDKGLSGGYSSSLTTLQTLTGDCTEHTVLLIALARSVGIPARICSGLVFSKNAFYYHFWAEVFVGKWVQMDPAFGQVIADANHIQLQGKTLESATMVEFTEGVFRTLNQLDIDVIE
ncbi:MAG: transglutaminase-like domain-containing protein [Candidatus Poribacteria bacterium]|nr:transglutaminase-like domain-containing protein [Candidatus Poribacteria bacterium]